MPNSDSEPKRPDRLGRAGTALLSLLLLAIGQGCAGPELEPWHTEDLTAEFTASKADEIRTFDDYLVLEEELFRELDEEVYADVATGPEFATLRYSPGSAADPRGRDPNWNRSFEWPAERAVGGVLLLHGLTDAPYTLRTLGHALSKRGYHVVALRMPGHGTAPSGLRSFTWRDMAAAARLGAEHLDAETGGKPLHVVGYSTGAALALNYTLDAQEDPDLPVPASIVLISPAVSIHPAAALAGFKNALGEFPGLGGLAWLQVVLEFDPYKYNSFATNAGAQVHRLTRHVARRVRERAGTYPDDVLPPVLVFKSTADMTVTLDAVVDSLLGLLAPYRHELVLFDINRFAVTSKLMVADPAPLTDRLIAESDLPFSVTFVTNENPESRAVVARYKPPFSAGITKSVRLGLEWPRSLLSLSHVALPFPPDDPLYGRVPPENGDRIFLGPTAIQGERGLLRFPADWVIRVRHNPFYDFLETRALEWVDEANEKALAR